MKPSLKPPPPRSDHGICCPVAGFGLVCASPDMVADLRRNPVPAPGTPMSPSFLKHSGDQTVVGMAAVYQAIYNHNLAGQNFSRWGVVAAPTFLGRAATAQALQRFTAEGAWGISPHVIPHHSLHAISGTISQALGLKGPNFGIGGGPGAVVEALLAAPSLMGAYPLPGLWVVLTEHEPEVIPSDPALPSPGQPNPETKCLALALALVPDSRASMGISLQICPDVASQSEEYPPDWKCWPPLTKVRPLLSAFSKNGIPRGKWRLGLNGWVELTNTDRRAEIEA